MEKMREEGTQKRRVAIQLTITYIIVILRKIIKRPKGKVVWNEGTEAVSPWFKIQVFHWL